jgi:hypothetical protein
MKAKRFCLFLLPLVFAAPAMAQTKTPDCQLSQLASFDLQTLSNGLVNIPVTIDGREYAFKLDSKTDGVSLSADRVDELRKPMASYVVADTFIVGPLHASNLRLYPDRTPTEFHSDGIFGLGGFSKFDLDLDFAKAKMTFFSPQHCAGQVVYWTKSRAGVVDFTGTGQIHVKVKIDGKPIDATIDTGSTTSLLSITEAKRLLGVDSNSPGVRSYSIILDGSTTKALLYSFQEIDFGDAVAVHNPHIVIVPYSMASDEAPLVLGMGILRQLHIYISNSEKKLYVTSATEQ